MGEKRSVFDWSGSSVAGQDGSTWSSAKWGQEILIGKQIFCNRALNMRNIVAVGFDMDYTLAQYLPETFESLAYNGTIKKLVNNLKYPSELLEWKFDWKYMVRGLVLDKKRGNILKMDRHKYVKVAHHGFKELSKEDKIEAYGNTLIRDSFDEPDYALIDTLFSLAEAFLFAQLVDFRDRHPGKFSSDINYARMYKDVRSAVDMCHRDGTLKQMVAMDPGKYINEDLAIVPMLRMLRNSGRATFLVTNSLWDYTNVVMNFLCGNQNTHGDFSCNYGWLENFDVVITGSSKPSFFHDNHSHLFEVDPESGMLLNTDNGTPIPQIGCSSPTPKERACRVFQGGNVAHLHKLLSIESSSQVLYIGDHIYGDILHSKKALGSAQQGVVPDFRQTGSSSESFQQTGTPGFESFQQTGSCSRGVLLLGQATATPLARTVFSRDSTTGRFFENNNSRKVQGGTSSSSSAGKNSSGNLGRAAGGLRPTEPGWRTMLVVPELEKEVELLWELRDTRKELQNLRRERAIVEDKIHHFNWSLKILQDREGKEQRKKQKRKIEDDEEDDKNKKGEDGDD